MRSWSRWFALLAFLPAGAGADAFTDVTDELGVGVLATADLGPGCAFADVDGDSDLDLMVVDGLGDPNAVFKQTSPRVFQDVAGTLGLDDAGWGKAVVFADYDNDGDQDLLYTRLQTTNILYRNDGATFTDVSAAAGFTFSAQNSGAAWADYDNDGFLDVYITTYGESANHLMRNQGDGTFTDATAAAGVANSSGIGFQPAWLDYDNDGDMDLYVSNDIFGTPNVLYRNNGNGTFTDVSGPSGAGIDMSAMGLAVGDFDNDGLIDIYITNTDAGNVLLKNDGDGTFTDVAAAMGVEANVICWGVDFLDYDHDGLLDLFMNVSSDDYLPPLAPGRGSGPPAGSPAGLRGEVYPNILYRNTGSGFEDVSAQSGLQNGGRSFCSTVGDYDSDGDLDIFITNWFVVESDSACAFYENSHVPRESSAQDWLRVKLIGTASNRDGVGARVLVNAGGSWQSRERQAGTSYLSSSDPILHFGLGQAASVDELYVRWPSGILESYDGIPGGQTITLVEGEGVPASAADPGIPAPGPWSVLSVSPNPARGGSHRILLQLGAARGSVTVHDARGRFLRTLAVGGRPGGTALVGWDGRDDGARPLPAGVYFLNLPGGGGAPAAGPRKIILID